MSDAAVHLKLDRILAGQDAAMARMTEIDETMTVFTASLSAMNDAVGTQTEVLNRLADALSQEEGGGDMHAVLQSIESSLTRIHEDGIQIVVLLGRLAPAVAQAAQDAVLMAMGDGVDIPPTGSRS